MKAVWVEWIDSAGMAGWTREAVEPAVIITLGFLIADEKDHVVVASSVDQHDHAHAPLAIPRVAIRGIWDVTF